MRQQSKWRNAAAPRLAAVLAAVLAFSLAGCEGNISANSLPMSTGALRVEASESSVVSPAQKAAAEVGVLRKLPSVRLVGRSMKGGINTGDAYYELTNSNALGYGLILKTDYATGVQSCICQKPGCSHTDTSCNAFVETMPRQNIYIINNEIYLCFGGFPYVGQPPEKQRYTTSYVDIISVDGLTKRRVAEFEKDLYVIFKYCDDNALYGEYYTMGANKTTGNYDVIESGILRFDTKTFEYSTLVPAFFGEAVIGIAQDGLVTSRTVSDQDLKALLENGNHEGFEAARQAGEMQYDKLNFITGERTEIACLPASTNMEATAYARRLWYEKTTGVSPGKQISSIGIYTKDILTGEETMVMDTSDGHTFGGLLSPDFLPPGAPQEPLLLMRNGAGPNSDSVTYVQEDTRELHETPLKTRQGKTPPLLAKTNEGRFLIAVDVVGQDTEERYCYALISPKDFWAGNAKFTEVKPYETAK